MRAWQDAVVTFFDAIYEAAGRDESRIPWQDAISRTVVQRWLDHFDPEPHRRALVVASGLGDDAVALAELGLQVTAFDSAATAVAWARERHPDAAVDWQVADLFDPPEGWTGGFDLVLEVFTVQSIEPGRQDDAAAAIAGFVAPGGTLVAVALVRDPARPPEGPPWPLDPATLASLGSRGLVPVPGTADLVEGIPEVRPGVRCVLDVRTRSGGV